jgi:hypothetical protein
MWRVDAGSAGRYCDGLNRRSFLQVGIAGMGTASLGSVMQAREAAASTGSVRKDTAVILIWLDGGPSHLDLYDMKPDAPAEYRGIWNPIPTNVPGIDITELFPLQARVADKFSIVRSLHHNTGDHFTGGHWMLTGRDGVSGANTAGKYPFFGAIATKMLGSRQPGVPANVAIPYAMSIGLRPGYFGGNYLGVQDDPFQTEGDPNADNFHVQNVKLASSLSIERLDNRRQLLRDFDQVKREFDSTGTAVAINQFEQQAFDLVTGEKARQAFDLNTEKSETRELYGRHSWGQSVLLARRLVEAGVTFVTCHFGGWDHHWDLKKGMENYLPKVDQAVSGLFTDLSSRGLYDRVLVVLCGEFSRTPRMNDGGNGGAPMSMGTPGRDHWGNAMFCLMGGGGVKGGRIVGSTNPRGEHPVDRPLRPGDIHHTIYHVLGVDPHVTFLNHAGRPVPAIDHGAVIQELL